MFRLKPFDFNDFSLKLTKYLTLLDPGEGADTLMFLC